ncbi:MAG TPA: glycosyltransferase [Dehalococcoidia bacterium]|nr:glycosyltransferase [Dehalococcoidia bacterium]
MLRVPTKETELAYYTGVISDSLLSEITQTAERLRGCRIVHVNATPAGGGVAEILQSLVPLMCNVGIDAEWYVIEPDADFFRVSKTLHHCLQGDGRNLSPEDIEIYLEHNRKSACTAKAMGLAADLWLIHDAQVLPLIRYLNSSPGVWVCHVDTTRPNETVREILHPYMCDYRMLVASMPEYLPAGNNSCRTVVFPPAIDPFIPKHRPLDFCQARKVLARLGLDPDRPIVSQVSRFDRWKDPWGVIDAYHIARKEITGLQLALVGAMTAGDDPDACEVLADVQQYSGSDPDIHLFSDPFVIGDLEVNAFQSGSDVIIQKSTREGFGLTVAEAMWKRTPVIGGNCGGIRLQIRNGETGFLVDDTPSCAQTMVTLLQDRKLARKIGEAGRESVRQNYLMPRLLRDYLHLVLNAVDGRGPAAHPQPETTATVFSNN